MTDKKVIIIRKGFNPPPVPVPPEYISQNTPSNLQPLVYWNSRLSHSGITSYKKFENIHRKVHAISYRNLLSQIPSNPNALSPVQSIPSARKLSLTQSHKIKALCSKLSYYSGNRHFESKKTGRYNFKVAFLTLTAPELATSGQILTAFDLFLDYLRRTANCTFVWKKELGETGKHLHFHILINNFIPYYIVEWKWRRLLIQEGVEWPVDNKGRHTKAHYRIEIPRSRKIVAHYIAKYMSKAYELPRNYGYISGHSHILTDCKEVELIENDIPQDELQRIMSCSKVIRSNYVTHVCCNLLKVKEMAPVIGALFEKQYVQFCEAITLPQKFYEC